MRLYHKNSNIKSESPTRNFFHEGLWLGLDVSGAPRANGHVVERLLQTLDGGSTELLGSEVDVLPLEVAGHVEALGLVAVASVEILDLVIPLGETESGALRHPVAVLHGHVIVHDHEDAGLPLFHLDPVAFQLSRSLARKHLDHVAHRHPEAAVRQVDPSPNASHCLPPFEFWIFARFSSTLSTADNAQSATIELPKEKASSQKLLEKSYIIHLDYASIIANTTFLVKGNKKQAFLLFLWPKSYEFYD